MRNSTFNQSRFSRLNFFIAFLLLISFSASAQFYTKHYIAPAPWQYFSKSNEIVIATNSSTPVSIKLYRSNGVLETTLSAVKGAPAIYRFQLLARDLPMYALNTVISGAGLIVESAGPTSVNLRNVASDENSGENNDRYLKGNAALTSFGDAGLGVRFRVGYYRDGSLGNFGGYGDQRPIYSIMATADNTTVKINNVVATTLNAGQSYLFKADIGTLVESSSPTVMNTAAGIDTPDGCGDSAYNQIPPEAVLGTEYFIERGKGNNTAEQTTIVATKDNTNVVIDTYSTTGAVVGTTTVTLATAGSFHTFSNGSLNTPFSASRVSSDKRIVVYSGTAQSCEVDISTIAPVSECGGSNFIETAKFRNYGTGTLPYFGYILLRSATDPVLVNGTNIESFSGISARHQLGTTGWYIINFEDTQIGSPNVLSLTSNTKMTVSIVQQGGGFSMAGFFSNFAAQPDEPSLTYISGGGCTNNTAELTTPPNFDPYQWYFNGVAISGANSSTYTATKTGNYTVSSTLACGAQTQSKPVNVILCTDLGITKTVDNATPCIDSNVEFTVKVSNLGGNNVSGVSVNDLLPSGYTYVSVAPSVGVYDSTAGTWSIGDVDAQSSVTLKITATVKSSGNYTNTATLPASIDTNTANNSASAAVNPKPSNLVVTNPTAVCSPSTVDLTASTITAGSTGNLTLSYWTDALATSPYTSATTASAGTYYIKAVSSDGCIFIKPVVVTMNTQPSTPNVTSRTSGATITNGSISCFGGNSITLRATNSSGYLWSTGETSRDIVVTADGVYSVKVMNSSNCVSNSSSAVTITFVPTAPTASNQTFCSSENKKVGDLVATGNNIKWYSSNSGGTALSTNQNLPTTAGTYNYFASQTSANNCESARTQIVVTINNTSSAPTASAQSFCAADNKKVGDLSPNGSTIKWYSASSGGLALSANQVLATGTYYVSQTVNSCGESARTSVAVTINNVPSAPTASSQTFCVNDGKTVNDLAVTLTAGSTKKWYNALTGGTAYTGTELLTTRTYYVSQSNACGESTRTAVAVTVNTTTAPTSSSQTFCAIDNKTVNDLAVNLISGATKKWYNANTGGTAYTGTETLNTGIYYVSQTLNSCESARTAVVVTVYNTAAPTANSQTFCADDAKKVSDLTVTSGTNLKWYNASTGGTQYTGNEILSSNNYYVSQTVNNCESTRTLVSVTVNPTPATPSINAGGSTTFCTGGNVVLTSTSGIGYLWSNGATTQSITVSNSGNYSVQVKNASGCLSASSTPVTVTVNTIPSAPIASDQAFCSVDAKTVSDLSPSGAGIKWYSSNSASTAYTGTETLSTGTYYVSQTTSGCESARTAVNVTVAPKPADVVTNSTICSGETYTWTANNTVYSTTQSGTRISNNGCTADQVLNLTVTPKPADVVTNATICSGDTYTWTANNTAYSTTQNGTRISNNGCTADQVLNLTVTPKPADVVTTASICSGETYTWTANNTAYSTTQNGTRISNNGCTADQVLNLTVTPKPADVVTNATICSGETYTWAVNNTAYSTTQSGTRISNNGCTADQVLNLTVTPKPADVVTNATICSGETYTWTANNTSYSTTQSGTRISNNGCTADQVLNLTVTPKPADVVTNATICSGDTYTWTANNTAYSTTQNGTRISNNGCTADQVLNLTVTPKPADVVTTASICSGETYTWTANNTAYSTTQNGTRISNNGCTADQVLNLTVTPKPADVVTNATICSGETYTWAVNNTAYSTTQSGTRISNNGCTADQVLNLTVTPKPADVVTNATICSGETYTWTANNTSYSTTQSGTRISNNGCTADQVLNLTVTPKPADVVTNATICSGETYTWTANNTAYSTTQNGTRISNNGCTADQVLNLTVTPKPADVVTNATICSGETYTWAVNNTVYSTTQSGTRILNNGCTADQVLNLTVNPLPATPSISAGGPTTFCTGGNVVLTSTSGTGYLWSNGATTQSITVSNTGNYSVQVTNASGCLSASSTPVTVTVNTIPSAPTASDQAFCSVDAKTVGDLSPSGAGIKWYSSNSASTAYTGTETLSTGTYYVSQTTSGCESARTAVNVTVDPKQADVVTNATICSGETYTWTANNTAYSTTQNGTRISNNGCTADQVLNLTVTPKPADVVTNATICSGETYTWTANNTVYSTTQSGTRISNNGCTADQVLNLTVNPLPATPSISAGGPTTFCTGGNVVLTSTSGTGYLWSNGATTQSITVSNTGNYSVQVTNASGCLSASSTPVTVTVNTIPSAPTASDQAFCSVDAKTVGDLSPSGAGIKWYSSNSASTAYTGTETLSTGTYYVSQTTSGCESARTAVNVTVDPKQADVVTNATICSGETYTWTANNTAYSTTQNGTRISNNGCTADQVLNLTVTPKPADVVTNATICSGDTYTWAVNNTAYSTTQSGTRISNNGCTADQVLNLTVTPKPADVVTNATICSGETYTWAANNTAYSTTQNGTRISNNGCTADQVLNLTVTPKPAKIITTATICSGDTYTWSANSTDYTISGTYPILNNGCTADQELQLTVTTVASPIVGLITQPTCSSATASVELSGLPTGNWTINPGNITGNTPTITITGLMVGNTYNYKVTDNLGCESAASSDIKILDYICAENDTPSTINGAAGGTISTVFVNDKINGSSFLPTDITVSTGSLPAGIVFNSDGTITVAPNTSAGTHLITYTICMTANASICDSATVEIVIERPIIHAVTETTTAINSNAGGTTISLTANDTLNGTPVVVGTGAGEVSFTLVSTLPAGLTVNADKTITVAPGTASGSYEVEYTICDNDHALNCDTVKSYIIVDGDVLVANADNPAVVTQSSSAQTIITVISNDIRNGNPLTASEVNIKTTTADPSGYLILDPTTGIVTLGANAPAGTYTLTYSICDKTNASNCSTATVTLIVNAPVVIPVIDAVTEITTAINSNNGGTTISLTANDTLNGSPVTVGTGAGEVTFTLVSTLPTGLTLNADKTITVAPGTASGSYEVEYTICDNDHALNCDTVKSYVKVVGDVLVANADNPTAVTQSSSAQTIITVISNDTRNGNPLTASEVDIKTTTADPSGYLILDPTTGIVTLDANAPAGTYTLTYSICDKTNASNCSTAAVTLTVNAPVVIPAIDAVNEITTAINSNNGGTTISLTANDTLNGTPVAVGTGAGEVSFTLVSTLPSGLTLNADKTITVAPGTASGSYEVEYTICDNDHALNCDTVKSYVQVVGDVLVANADNPASVAQSTTAQTIITVVDNDTRNGQPLTASEVKITTTVADPSRYLVLDPTTGTVTLGANAPAGIYTLTYSICDKTNASNCSTETVTLTVNAPVVIPAIDAVNETTTAINSNNGGTTISLTANDTLNGTPVVVGTGAGKVTFTLVSTLPSGLTLNADKTITVAPGTASGSYEVEYTICDNDHALNCDTVKSYIIVVGDLLVLKDDLAGPIAGVNHSVNVINVLANDTKNGLPIAASDVNLSVTVVDPAGYLTLNPDGMIVLKENAPAGTYGLTYQVCELNTSNCKTAEVKVTVVLPTMTVTANSYCSNDVPYVSYNVTPDNFTTNNLLTVKWIDSDNNVVATQTNLPLSGSILWPGAIVDSNGIGVDWPGWLLANGQWIEGADGFEKTRTGVTVEFSLNPTASIVVNYPPATPQCNAKPTFVIKANNDNAGPIDAKKGISTALNIFSNDRLNGVVVNQTAIVLSTVVANPNLILNADGSVDVKSGTPSGTYQLTYQICEASNLSNCSQAVVNVTVVNSEDPAPTAQIVTKDDLQVSVDGVNGQLEFVNVLDNDLVNGLPIDPSNVVISNTPKSPYFEFNADGTVNVKPNTPGGTYVLVYQVCEKANASNCSSSTLNVFVEVPNIAIIKTAVFNDENANGFANAGETITYKFKVTNTGNVALKGITITDPLLGVVVSGQAINLEVGESNENNFTAKYKVTQNDIIAGKVSNQATALGKSARGVEVDDKSDDVSNTGDNPTVLDLDGCEVKVLNAFSPNGDLKNARFYIQGIECYPENTVEIYNRWGVLVFDIDHYNNEDRVFVGFSGGRATVKESDGLPGGTYFYTLKYKDSDSNQHEQSGYLYLNK
ncbi:gliding motility-associated C-terminal domain-containing protein [Flavobacterium sp. KACC 22761]|uniref:Ig-like domain-containing protein n=1 Tax=Flavobacterium sp. KACC 22761 TaxID=3092665 RepID=UPI002A75F9FB|nr:gliding motility-associated C-terminal domain-containing protein [Flavobacterium sp. KACC 22761]WPO80722.1 gliding motility-associated C-terminal domain-containing protein [Flavobacterium sp. KACC 22761]